MDSKLTVWIDLDNSPHVLFFAPIIEELKRRGHEVFVTARDYSHTLGLLQQLGIDHKPIGRHYGKSKTLKLIGLGVRTAQLLSFVATRRFSVAVSHGSRSLMFAAGALRIPSVGLFDYEHSKASFLYRVAELYLIPEAIKDESLPGNIDPTRVKRYPGTKEYVYISRFQPTTDVFREMGLDTGKVGVLIRPPANEAHYHNEESDSLMLAVLDKVSRSSDAFAVVMPRTKAQRESIMQLVGANPIYDNIMVLKDVVDGPSLVWSADLVISGGGTMNREAAALGVPAYSIFRGQVCAVDRYLVDKGKLTLIRSVNDIDRIELKKRSRSDIAINDQGITGFIADQIIAVGMRRDSRGIGYTPGCHGPRQL